MRGTTRAARIGLLTFALAVAVAGCGGNSGDKTGGRAGGGDAKAAADDSLSFYSVIHGNANDLYWAQFRKGIEDASKQMDVTTKLLATQQFSVQGFVDMLESAIAAKPDGLIASIPDQKAADELLRRAIDGGIPVITVDTGDPRPRDQRIPYLL